MAVSRNEQEVQHWHTLLLVCHDPDTIPQPTYLNCKYTSLSRKFFCLSVHIVCAHAHISLSLSLTLSLYFSDQILFHLEPSKRKKEFAT